MKPNEALSLAKIGDILSKHTIQADRKRVIVAFGDVIGFAKWLRRASNSPEEVKFFLTRLYKRLAHMKEQGFFMKAMADGGMVLRELPNGHNCNLVADFLKEMIVWRQHMMEIIRETEFPRPEGFRVRVTVGHALKIGTSFCDRMCVFHNDYVGYPINLACRMLKVESRTIPFMAHESVVDVLEKKARKKGIEFTKIRTKDRRMDGIDVEDMANLWSFNVIENKGDPHG